MPPTTQEADEPTSPPELRAELGRRLRLADADPSRGIPWEDVLAAARARHASRGPARWQARAGESE